MAGRSTWGLFLALAVAVAVALRVPYLTTRSIWYDEAASWQTARFPLSGTLESLRLNVHPPLYYWILKPWMAVAGESVLALRGLSVLFGLATVAGMYRAARACGARSGGGGSTPDWSLLPAAVALLVAVNAYQINAAIEARMYSLGTALTALSAWTFLRLLANPSSRSRWLAHVGVCVAMLYTHHYCLFIVGSEFAFLFGYCALEFCRRGGEARRLFARSLAAAAVVALAYVPGVFLLSQQVGRVREDYWTEPLSVDLAAQTFLAFISPVTGFSDETLWGGLCFSAFAAAGAIVAFDADREEAFVLVMAVLPIVFAGAVTLLAVRVWDSRLFRFSQLFVLFLLALAIRRLFSRPAARAMALTALLAGMTAASIDFWGNRQIATRPGMRGAMERILSTDNGRDPIVADCKMHYFPAKYYAPPGVSVRILEPATHEFWGRHLIRSADMVSEEDFRASLAKGVWYLSYRPMSDDDEFLADTIADDRFESPYDFGVYPWTVYVSHVRLYDETARIGKAIAKVEAGTSTELDLTCAQRVAEYVPRLSRLTTLRAIRLDATATNNEQLRQLSRCSSLSSLSLLNTEVTDDGMPVARGAAHPRNLETRFHFGRRSWHPGGRQPAGVVDLSLACTRVTDTGLAYLERAKKLRRLNLQGTAVTDRGAAHLANLTELAELNLTDTAVTEPAAERLRSAIPRLWIRR